MTDNNSVLGRDIPLDMIDKEICRVIKFTPRAKVINDKVVANSKTEPYAFLTIETKKIPGQAELPVFHKDDFQNVYEAFNERKEGQEILVVWSNNNYKNVVFRISRSILPKLIVWLCQKDAYQIMTDQRYKPELTGEARFLAERPIKEWKPEVMN
ncbi:hypothetical protein HYS93_03530 [Candidatus Daviesbacteria bacterium]|nr:hypothetical protein [Candidatus Daviesbacteria bacterium]